jgi:NAD(P)-dependent dehydrogenase (short-subunit alcohol dehydrogenase family)
VPIFQLLSDENYIKMQTNSLLKKFLLKDEVAIITGGAGLLGRKHAEAIAEVGGIPILLDIDKPNGEIINEEISKKYQTKCSFEQCDITDEDNLRSINKKILRKYKHIDILINNAAIDPKVKKSKIIQPSRLENMSLEQWNMELSVGLTGAMLCSKVFGSEMAKLGGGTIINVSSDLGLISPDQRLYRQSGLSDEQQPVKPITYSVIKHGIIGMTKYLATYWAKQGIRVNSISPGGVYTNQPQEFVEKISELIPMGRMANENEYKAAIVFLCSDASSYMTGANLVIDGGRTTL